jgi:long-chain fatty acid transport protein
MKKVIALSIITASMLFANGYKIPEQSLSGMALSAANVANAHGADANYYNPANMVFNEDKNSYEFLMTYINLPKVKFENANGEVYYSREENFLIPQFHFSSKDYDGWRWGVSLTTPAGLSKRWDNVTPEAGAKEFTLKTVELNPTVAKKINENTAFAVGIRIVKSEGIANGLGSLNNNDGTITPLYSEYLNGDSLDYGWNAALTYHNFEHKCNAAITYRSKVDVSLSGDASGYYSKALVTRDLTDINTYIPFVTNGRVSVPIPAALNLAFSKTFNKTTVEFVFERTYWSSYKKLDFDFDDPYVNAIFGNPKPKDWKDVNTYRIGLTHQCTPKLTAMLGYAYDKTPVPDSTIDFSLPDSDKHIFSGGFKYKMDDRMSLGFSVLYTKQKTRSAKIKDDLTSAFAGTDVYTVGTFKDGGALLMAFGMDYSF